jgi:3-phenylpropionate/trans-cinnamate dioxygenase ferredoxin reductase subunit
VADRTFVIVGAGLAGAKAAETLRGEGFDGRIVLIGEEPERPYERPPLSKGYLQGKAPRDKAFVHDPDWYRANNVDLRLGVRATALDPAARTVTVEGTEPERYDRLLLATGAYPRRLDVPGSDLAGVRYLRTVAESDALKDALAGGPRVVVVGAGWIGLEVAAAARAAGAAVTVVEADALPLRRVLGDEVAELFAGVHRAGGVEFRFDSGVAEFRGDGARLTAVVLSDGTELAADLAVVGIGVQPATELAVAGGLAVDNGVLVDAGLRTSAPDVFACGDVANVDSPLLGQRVRVEHWANALNGGKAAALALLDRPVSYDRVPYFYTDQFELGMEYSGYVPAGGYDEVVFRGGRSVGDGFIVFWLSEGRVLAGMNVNVWDVVDEIQALVRAGYGGRAVDRARLADPAVPLGELLG